MSEQLDAQGGDRGLVRIARSERGRSWAVTVRVGDQAEDLERAYAIAASIEQLLRSGDEPEKRRRE